jgi:hypothetical protein
VKATFHRRVSREKLLHVLPPVFVSRIPQALAEPTTAVVFRDDVVTGRVARKALERVGSDFGLSLIFAGPDFTQEACDLASASGIFLVTATQDGGYFWSDQSLADILRDVSSHRPLRSSPPEVSEQSTPNA